MSATLALTTALLCGEQAGAFPVITNVVETGGDNEASDTITAKWTGVTWNTTMANEPTLSTPVGTAYTVPTFGEDVPCMVDRAHQWNGASASRPIPSYLAGAEYIMIGNDNRDNNPFQLDLYLRERSVVFLLIDYRRGDSPQSNTDPPFNGAPLDSWPLMTWVNAGGFQPFSTGWNRSGNTAYPDEVGYDEGSDGTGPGAGLNQWAGVYYKVVDPGAGEQPAISLYEQGEGVNMYGAVVVPTTPPAPGGVQAASQDARVTLNWSTAAGATNYIIWRSTVNGGPYSELATNASTTFTDSTVLNGETYYYVVSTMGMFGMSGYSAQVTGAPRLAPENFTAIGGTNQVALNWTAMPNAVSYTVKKAVTSGGPFTNLATGVTAAAYIDSGLGNGQRFYYTVSAALTGGGESANADEASAVTAPSVPAGFAAERFAATVIKLSWNSPDPVAPTTLVERSANGTTFTQIAAVTNNSSLYFDIAGASVTNSYRVRATNSGGFSSYTEVDGASTPASGINVNFANTNFTAGAAGYPLPGFLDDYGFVYGDRGNGRSYGWDADNTQHARLRNAGNSVDKRYDTFNHSMKDSPVPYGRTWEIAVPNGLYLVHIVSGDPTATDSVFQWDAEGWVSESKQPNNPNYWQEFYITTKVEDGKLTLNNGPLASNNKINFADIYPTAPQANLLGVQPASQTVTQNQAVVLSLAVAGGPEPYKVRWFGPAGELFSENNEYRIPSVQLSDAGAYYAVVTNAGASTQSTNAVLTVLPDTWAPIVLSAGSLDGSRIGVRFNEAVDSFTAMTIENYLVNGQPLVSSVLQRDERTMELFMNLPLAGNFTLTARNIRDLAGNTLASQSVNGIRMGLTAEDIGGASWPGESFTVDGITLLMTGAGGDIWGVNDQGHFAYKQVSGDFDARVRVEFLSQANVWSKAGLMVRETSAGGSRNVFVLVTPLPANNLYQTQWREVADDASASAPTLSPVSYPDAWLRLIRQGNTFTSMVKTNGTDWVFFHSYTPTNTFSGNALLGLALTSHDIGRYATGVFSSFSTTAPIADIAVSALSSSPTVALGGSVDYQVMVVNQGATAQSVSVATALPAGTSYTSSSTTNGTASHAAGSVTWNIGTMPPGAVSVLSIAATVNTAGAKTIASSATLAGSDENPDNNSASVTVQVQSVVHPVITAATYVDGKFGFTIATEVGLNYSVVYTDSLTNTTWLTLTNFVGDGLLKPVVDQDPSSGARFYRALIY